MKKNYLNYFYFFTFALLLSAGNFYLFAKPKDETIWNTRQNLVFRLGSEWYKIGLLKRDLSFVSDILSDFRDLELFPLDLIGFDENELLYFDKQIEKCEKKNALLLKNVDLLKPPLSDALSITKELVTGDPVESMFDVLEQGDLKRINDMIGIKHEIDRFWIQIDSLLNYLSYNAGIQRFQDSSNQFFDKEFFEILEANLGRTADRYFEKLNILKQHMISKADTTQIREIYKIELYHLSVLMKNKDFDAAIRKTGFLIPQYENLLHIDELYLILAQLHLQHEDFPKVLEDLSRIIDTKQHGNRIALHQFQTLYALKRYSEIISLSQNTDFNSFPENNRNLLIWITLESAISLKLQDFSATTLLTSLAKNQPYSIHAMHAFSRLLLEKGDTSSAFSILQSVKSDQVITPEDELARQKVDLSIAWISFQNGHYEEALTQFFQLLKNESLYDRALFGILWCYIKTGQNDKAETALRKLINQSPQSPLAADGILILAERYLNKAWSSWKKSVYLFNEEERLTNMFKKLESRFNRDSLDQQYSTYIIARDELKMLTQRIKQEPRESYSQIVTYYDQIEKVCNLISHHYKSGTFQEASFSQEREKILYFLDSILITIKNDGNNSYSKRKYSQSLDNRSAIKMIVDKSAIFSIISSLDKYRWEREYIDQQKTTLSKQVQLIETEFSKVKESLICKSLIKEKDSLNNTMNILLKEEDHIHEFYFTVLSNKLSTLVKTDLNTDDRAYFNYQLGELYYSQENRNYAKKFESYELAYNDYELKLKAFRNGAHLILPVQPVAPALSHDSSIQYFRSVIELLQPSEYLHAAHYSLAWCYNDLGLLDSALVHFHLVATEFPSSPYAPQSWMYCGEYYFDKGKLDTAISCYHSVMKYPESEWFDEALYKQAWAQYRLSNPEKAISSFLALVDLGEGNVSGKSLLEKESMDYIAISFSETDPTGPKGLHRAIAFVKKLNDGEKGSRILQRLASVYSDQGRHDLAIKTIETLLNINPNYIGSPQADYKLITLLERGLSPQEINQKKFDFYKKYSINSQWTSSRQDSLLRISTDSLAERMLYNSAIGFHQLALQKSDSNFFNDALKAYREYIRSYPSSAFANECHYNLAEIQFSIGNYKEAAEEYMAVSKRYPDSKYKETAAWNAIVASQNYLKQESSNK